MSNEFYRVTGHWADSPNDFYDVIISKGGWDGKDDDGIFYYMDGVELQVGDIIGDGFVVSLIED